MKNNCQELIICLAMADKLIMGNLGYPYLRLYPILVYPLTNAFKEYVWRWLWQKQKPHQKTILPI